MTQRRKQGDDRPPFVQIEDWVVEILGSGQLSRVDHQLFWYLFKLERWGDQFVDLPSQSEIALALGLSRETINRSQAKLQELRLFDFRITGWQGRNLAGPASAGFSAHKKKSAKNHSVSESDHTLSESDHTLSESDHTLSESDHTLSESDHSNTNKDRARALQTYSDFLQTLSDRTREIFEKFVRDGHRSRTGDEIDTMDGFLKDERARVNWWRRFINSPEGKKAAHADKVLKFNLPDLPPSRLRELMDQFRAGGRKWIDADPVQQEFRQTFVDYAKENKWFRELYSV